jgi:hypothetical protein
MPRTYVSIASGASLALDDLETVKQARESGIIRGVACTNLAYEAAPWADYLVGVDRQFWEGYPESLTFKGGKFAPKAIKGTIRFCPNDYEVGENSGLYALKLLRELGAETIILLGYDMKGAHFHEPHTIKNPDDAAFKRFREQFTRFKGCDIINSTPDSALDCFPKMTLERALNVLSPDTLSIFHG